MRAIDVVSSLIHDPTNRETIELAWIQDVEEFWIGLSLATSPDYDFGLDRVPGLPEDDQEEGSLTFEEFYDVAIQLANGDLTGTDAHRAVEAMALRASADEWNLWYRRILLKSLSRHLPMAMIQSELIRLTTE